MRAMHDALMIGIGTVLADDPLLTVRLPGVAGRTPLRIVLDSDLRLPPQSRFAVTAEKMPALAISGERASEERDALLRKAHVEVAQAPRDAAGHVDLTAALNLLAARGLTRVCCEGGPRVAAALIGQGLADEVVIITAPEPLGREGVLGLALDTAAVLADPQRYRLAETRMIGADRLTRHERVI
jgi:diaminohydroxyphosphoribosylaminopyrimidine deaminase / 5-amino-6-(5-phosphoribosylamino)uracil reductase